VEKYRGLFVSESEAHLEAMSKGVLDIEPKADVSPEKRLAAVHEVFRHLHSLKGMGATMGFDDFGGACHQLEELMSEVRENKRQIERELVDVLLFAVDQLGLFVAAIRDRADPPPLSQLLARAKRLSTPEPERPPVADAIIETGQLALKVFIEERSATPALRAFLAAKRLHTALGPPAAQSPPMDRLKMGELPQGCVTLFYAGLIDEQKVTSAIAGLSEVARYEISPVTQQPAFAVKQRSDARVIRVRTSVLDELLDAAGELLIAESRVEALVVPERDTPVARAIDLLQQAVRGVHSRAMALRTVPFSTVAERYPRVVRDAASTTGKLVELQTTGLELELDRAVLEAIDSGLVHLLRNAVDHGIEPPQKRIGKPGTGVISLKAERDRDAIAITVQDDGAGIDELAIRMEAQRRGLMLPAGTLSPAQIVRVLAQPGFSTKSTANQISGRGVGMDAVLDAVESLGGTLELQFEVGKFTRFTLRLPPSIAVQPVLRVIAAGTHYGLPLRRVLATSEAQVRYRGEELPTRSLAELLHHKPTQEERWAVIVEDPGGPMALSVEKVLDVRDVVIKKLGPPASSMRVFDGATVLSDGRPMMILDVGRLISHHSLR
jgi:two-component system chemotaxis sensor kinase CheA